MSAAGGPAMAARKWPILFAGVMLGDGDMQSIDRGALISRKIKTPFFVSQAAVDITHSLTWVPNDPADVYGHGSLASPRFGLSFSLRAVSD